MQKIIATKTASLTDLRDPMKVIEAAGDDSPIAILNRNKIVGYFIPEAMTDKHTVSYADDETVQKITAEILKEDAAVLDYLKDK